MFKEKAKAAVLALLFCVLPGCVAPEPTNTDIKIIDNTVVVKEGFDNKVIIEDEVVDEVVDNAEEVEPTIENPTVVEENVEKNTIIDEEDQQISILIGVAALFVGMFAVYVWIRRND